MFNTKGENMKLTILKLVALSSAINDLINAKMAGPVQFGYALQVNQSAIATHITAFEKQRQALIESHAERDENNDIIYGKDEKDQQILTIKNTEEFNKELNDLLTTEINIDFMELEMSWFPSVIDASLVAGVYPIIKAPN